MSVVIWRRSVTVGHDISAYLGPDDPALQTEWLASELEEVGPQEPVLSYATPASLPTQQSRYAVASLAVSAIAILWLALAIMDAPLPFDVYKQHRIGTVASVLGLILAIASYWQPNRRRSMAHVAITVSGLAFFAYFLLAPL
jgi:hypothetical protein